MPAGTCISSNFAGGTSGVTIALSVGLGGLATLVEKKSRRMELALYCFCRAVEALLQCLVEWGILSKSNFRLDVVLFSMACGAITHCYSDDGGKHRDIFRRVNG